MDGGSEGENFIKDIRIKKTKILGDEDYKDNEKDTFTAFISGKFVSYTMSERTAAIFENSKKKPIYDFLIFSKA